MLAFKDFGGSNDLFIYLFISKESQAFGHVPRAQEQVKEPGKLKTHTKDTTRIKFHTKETVFITERKKSCSQTHYSKLGTEYTQ